MTLGSRRSIRLKASPAAEALRTIVDCGPEGSSAFGPSEAANAFAQGQAAMFLDSIAFAGTFEDESRSTVAGNVGWAPHPVGVRAASQTGGFGLAIPRNAENPDAAFLLMQWLTSREGGPYGRDGRRQIRPASRPTRTPT